MVFENTPAIQPKKVKVDTKFALKIVFINKIRSFGIDDYYVLAPYKILLKHSFLLFFLLDIR